MFISDRLSKNFWKKINKSGDCWEWMGALNRPGGYGRINVNADGKTLPIRAHRLSYMIHYGSIPDGLCVLHKCDNPRCCNPNHLFLGSHSNNSNDKVIKGRAWFKYHPEQIEEIKRMKLEGYTKKQISDKFGLSRKYIQHITNGRARNTI